jgi:SAM-dependent methyltransferase
MTDPAVRNPFYDDAAVYDILHTPGTARELNGVARAAARFGSARERPHWLEPACGSGRCLRLAAARGLRITGFDLNPAMIDYARERLARRGLDRLASVREGDLRTFADEGVCPPASITVAFNIINTFRHLMTDSDALAHLGQVARVLTPGGVYVVGLSTCAYGLDGPTEDVWAARRGATAVTQVVQYIPPAGPRGGTRVERVLCHLTVRRAGREFHQDSTYRLRAYSLDQWNNLLARAPLRWVGTLDESGREDPPAESGYRLFVLAR